MDPFNLTLNCCHDKYSSTRARSLRSAGYQWSPTLRELLKYASMAALENGNESCLTVTQTWPKWHFAEDSFKCIFMNENLVFSFQSHCFSFGGSNWQYVFTDSGDGLVPHRRQVITETDDDVIVWYLMVLVGDNDSNTGYGIWIGNHSLAEIYNILKSQYQIYI